MFLQNVITDFSISNTIRRAIGVRPSFRLEFFFRSSPPPIQLRIRVGRRLLLRATSVIRHRGIFGRIYVTGRENILSDTVDLLFVAHPRRAGFNGLARISAAPPILHKSYARVEIQSRFFTVPDTFDRTSDCRTRL